VGIDFSGYAVGSFVRAEDYSSEGVSISVRGGHINYALEALEAGYPKLVDINGGVDITFDSLQINAGDPGDAFENGGGFIVIQPTYRGNVKFINTTITRDGDLDLIEGGNKNHPAIDQSGLTDIKQ
jgi:hypothetical protein